MKIKKRSNKYDACIKCHTTEIAHHWRWLCTSCWDKERYKKPKRKEQVKKIYEKNRERRTVIRRVYWRRKKGLSNMKMIIDWKEIDLPFETLEKPCFFKKKEFKKWEKNNEIFEKIKLLFNKKNYEK